MPSYLMLRTPTYTEVGVVSELYQYRRSRPPDDLNILRWVLIRSAVTVLRYIIRLNWIVITEYYHPLESPDNTRTPILSIGSPCNKESKLLLSFRTRPIGVEESI